MNIRPLIAAILLLAVPALAQDKKNTATAPRADLGVRKQIDDFFAAIENHQIDAAYDQLTKDTKIGERSDDITTLKSKTQQAIQLFGDLQGHEIVDVKNVGAHLLRVTFLSLGKDFPLRWRFYYYRSGDAWKLIDIRVDDRLADLFGEQTAPEATPQRPTNWPKSN